MLDSRADASPEVAAAGMVVNTMGYIDGLGYELLLHAIKALRVRVQCWGGWACHARRMGAAELVSTGRSQVLRSLCVFG